MQAINESQTKEFMGHEWEADRCLHHDSVLGLVNAICPRLGTESTRVVFLQHVRPPAKFRHARPQA
jgi:hypothetical protein